MTYIVYELLKYLGFLGVCNIPALLPSTPPAFPLLLQEGWEGTSSGKAKGVGGHGEMGGKEEVGWHKRVGGHEGVAGHEGLGRHEGLGGYERREGRRCMKAM